MVETNRRLVAAICNYLVTITTDEDISEDDVINSSFILWQYQDISIPAFIKRLLHYTDSDESTIVCALILFKRYVQQTKTMVHEFSVKNMFGTAFMLASKIIEDEVFSNRHFAVVIGVELKQMNQFESLFCNDLNFELNVYPEEFFLLRSTLVGKRKSYN